MGSDSSPTITLALEANQISKCASQPEISVPKIIAKFIGKCFQWSLFLLELHFISIYFVYVTD